MLPANKYKITSNYLTMDVALNPDEIKAVHAFWFKNRLSEDWAHLDWKEFNYVIGLSCNLDQTPNWKIENKGKWIWAKLMFNF